MEAQNAASAGVKFGAHPEQPNSGWSGAEHEQQQSVSPSHWQVPELRAVPAGQVVAGHSQAQVAVLSTFGEAQSATQAPLQSAKPLVQLTPQAPLVQVAVALAGAGQVTPAQGSRQHVLPTLQQKVPVALVHRFSGRQQTFAPLSWVEQTLPAGQHSSLPGALMQLSLAPQQIVRPSKPVQVFGHVQVQLVGSST